MGELKTIKKVLVANRGEIAIRVFRACKELGIKTVAIYTEEDKKALFRTKADESYQIGKGMAPVAAYLNYPEIIELAKEKGVDAIHPGYGFLSENPDFADACEAAGIEFIGPTGEMMNRLGDKIQSKLVAKEVNVPTVPGIEAAIEKEEDAVEFAKVAGYPVILKAAAGGGGRGMRVVRDEKDIVSEFKTAQSEAIKAFGNGSIFIEKYLEEPKHIEVQVLGDKYGNLVHLFERDCSIQRRHQKVVEFTPSLWLTDEQRAAICADALKIAKAVNYRSAGTVEFLMDKHGNHYFIEMNPRIQVEHTVSELVTGRDIVQAQLYIAMGKALDSEEINIKSQDDITQRGYAIQCRVTTEDPVNGFAPDTGTITSYHTAGGFGVRLDGNAYKGYVVSPYYDSLLVKITSFDSSFIGATHKAIRALKETEIKGVKTNLGFLLNVLNHPIFQAGECNTGFIGDNPELMDIPAPSNRSDKMMAYIANKAVNENHGVKPKFVKPEYPKIAKSEIADLRGTKQLLDEQGPEAVSKWVMEQKKLLITDTTMRDAQQSLFATRMRTIDMERIAPAVAKYGKDLFSLEMWGGATFDTAYRFLKESPWERLATLRELIPNVLFQMLLRGANAVGYKNYPDNVIREFVKCSAEHGIDVFRVFDSLNWIEGMSISLDEVRNQGKIAEATMCYTGDILDPSREKYNLNYYVKLAKELEKRGANMLAIKDMSGLLKPAAAYKLVKTLKEEVGIPIHLHTHDTCGAGVSTLFMAAQAGVDVVDAAINSMSGLTSQPALNTIAAAMENTERATGLDLDGLQVIDNYYTAVRPIYKQFESGLQASSAEIYKYEIPGGQYSNLKPQVDSFGLGDKFEEVKAMYKTVNDMLGDIVKVTPSSKAVGDMAIFMVQNDLTPENIIEKGTAMDFPDSISSYFEGMMGQPEGGFPKDLQRVVLKDKKPITCRPGELLPPEDFDYIKEGLIKYFGKEGTPREVISYAMYPKVYEDYMNAIKKEGYFRYMESDVYFYGIGFGETAEVTVAPGVTMIVELLEITDHVDDQGQREVYFEVNGVRRSVWVKDNSLADKLSAAATKYADPDNPLEVGANIPGNIVKVLVKAGDAVEEGQPIAVIEAMKMETNIISTATGTIADILVKDGAQVKAGELIAVIEQ